jgi:hypothetical protein
MRFLPPLASWRPPPALPLPHLIFPIPVHILWSSP